jgi:AbrB family looped-hinge helix DNA binding protein
MQLSATTKLSSKGQVVIPEDIRINLGLHSGDQFVVIGNKDTIVFKLLIPPSMADFDRLILEARKQARKAGLKKSDIKEIIASVRQSKR